MSWSRPAAAAHNLGSGLHKVRGQLSEKPWLGVVDDLTVLPHAWETGVGLGPEDGLRCGLAHLVKKANVLCRIAAAVGSNALHQGTYLPRDLLRAHAHHRTAVGIETEGAEKGKLGNLAYTLDGSTSLSQVAHGLYEQQIDASGCQSGGLFCVRFANLLG
jgi:hypothetical protein